MNYEKQNYSLAKNIIELQKAKGLPKWIFEEIGANVGTVYTLGAIDGTSEILQKGVCSYDQYEQIRNPKDPTTGKHVYRSVSREFILAGLDHYNQQHKTNSLFIQSFQTVNNPTQVTHGWIGIQHQTKQRLYHITIPDHYNRIAFQKIVAHISLQLITECLNPAFIITTPYIDHVYDGEQQNITKTIDLMQKDSVVCIDASGNLCRIEDITRSEGYQPLIIYKGSFDPPHKGHLHIMETMQKKYPNHKALFSISVNNYDKGDVSSHEIIDRIKMINTLGYPVILFGSALFKDNIDRVRLKNGQEIIFPVGSDTVERILNTYENKDQIAQDFNSVRFEAFGREQFQCNSVEYEALFVQNNENPYEKVSSRSIRNNIHEHKENIPEKIRNFCINKYGHK